MKQRGHRCIVIDGQVMVMQMLCGVLRTFAGVEIVGTGRGHEDADRLTAIPGVDLAIVAADSCDGDLLDRLLVAHPRLHLVILTARRETWKRPAILADRLIGVVDKTAPLQDLLAKLPSPAGELGERSHAPPGRHDLLALLTPRQCDVVDALAKGLTNKEIAIMLGITVQTVETHRKVISKKLGCNGASLVRLATLTCHLSLETQEGSPMRRGRRERSPAAPASRKTSS